LSTSCVLTCHSDELDFTLQVCRFAWLLEWSVCGTVCEEALPQTLNHQQRSARRKHAYHQCSYDLNLPFCMKDTMHVSKPCMASLSNSYSSRLSHLRGKLSVWVPGLTHCTGSSM
jgi:hypothetical protein